jgi:hypothetical protein
MIFPIKPELEHFLHGFTLGLQPKGMAVYAAFMNRRVIAVVAIWKISRRPN